LADLLTCCPWLRLHTPRGLGRLLQRLGIRYQRGRDYLHSPDPDYAAKQTTVAVLHLLARLRPTHHRLLFLDELTLYRQPTLASAWEARGTPQPRARRSYTSDTRTRLLGALNATTGELHQERAAHITIPRLIAFASSWPPPRGHPALDRPRQLAGPLASRSPGRP